MTTVEYATFGYYLIKYEVHYVISEFLIKISPIWIVASIIVSALVFWLTRMCGLFQKHYFIFLTSPLLALNYRLC